MDECEEDESESSASISFIESFWEGSDQTEVESDESPRPSPFDAVLQAHTDSTGITIDDALDFVSGFVCPNDAGATSESSGSVEIGKLLNTQTSWRTDALEMPVEDVIGEAQRYGTAARIRSNASSWRS
jgi:hypothetical protein